VAYNNKFSSFRSSSLLCRYLRVHFPTIAHFSSLSLLYLSIYTAMLATLLEIHILVWSIIQPEGLARGKEVATVPMRHAVPPKSH